LDRELVDFFEWVVLPALTFLLLRRLGSITLRDCGLAGDLRPHELLAALFLCTLTLFLVNLFGGRILGPILFGYPENPFRMDLALAALGPFSTLGVFYLSATAGVCESLFFLALPWLWFSGASASRWKGAAFAALSAAVFALGHWETGLASVTGGFLFQLLAVAWYRRLKSLWPIIGAHFLIDLFWFWPATRGA